MLLKYRTSQKIQERAIYAGTIIVILLIVFLCGKNSITPNPFPADAAGAADAADAADAAYGDPTLHKRSTPTRTHPPDDPDEPWIETLSWQPRLFLYHNFLTKSECEEIVKIGQDGVTRSEVVSEEGTGKVDSYRTSHGLFFTDNYMQNYPILRDIERRLAEWTHLPIENGEAYYLLRYEVGQFYKSHVDFFSDDDIGKRYMGDYGNRYATVLTYLCTPEEGGSTEFPRAGITVPVKAGDAVLFWDLHPTNEADPMSEHASIAVTKGVKWAMTKWIREKPFYRWDTAHTEKEKNEYYNIDKQWREQNYK